MQQSAYVIGTVAYCQSRREITISTDIYYKNMKAILDGCLNDLSLMMQQDALQQHMA